MTAEVGAPPVKSAERALALIEYVAENRTVSFTQVMRDLQLPRSSASGLIATLLNSGWLVHDPAGRGYTLGLRAWQVGEQYSGHRDLALLAKPIMDRLRTELGETIQLAKLDGVENVYIAISESAQPMRLQSSVGMRLKAHATGIGKSLLAMLDRGEVLKRFDGIELPKLTEHTVSNLDDLIVRVDEARARGWSIDDEEFVSGCRCVAVPLLIKSSGEPMAISVTMPTSRTAIGWPESLVGPLQAAADEIRHAVEGKA